MDFDDQLASGARVLNYSVFRLKEVKVLNGLLRVIFERSESFKLLSVPTKRRKKT